MHESYCKKITSGKSVRGDTKVVPWTRKQRTEQVVGSRWSLRESGLLVVCSTGRIVMGGF